MQYDAYKISFSSVLGVHIVNINQRMYIPHAANLVQTPDIYKLFSDNFIGFGINLEEKLVEDWTIHI